MSLQFLQQSVILAPRGVVAKPTWELRSPDVAPHQLPWKHAGEHRLRGEEEGRRRGGGNREEEEGNSSKADSY